MGQKMKNYLNKSTFKGIKPLAVVGTNSWGSAVYGKVLRGESVDIR